MSPELIATLSCFVTLGVSMIAGFAWVIRRIDGVEHRLGTRIDAVNGELTEVKIAVARIEGPARQFLTPRQRLN